VERFGLDDGNLAVACGSHRGEPRHVRTALDTLRSARVPPEALQCGTHELAPAVGAKLSAAGLSPTPLHNNCSGKHAGMLASASALECPIESYLEPENPLQQMILATVSKCSGLPSDRIRQGLDGCSAPNFAMPMRNIGRCFATIADHATVGPELCHALDRVGGAMLADPWLVCGTGEFDTVLMSALDGAVISKAGAEALQCVALPRYGLGVAVKIESGQSSGLPTVVLAILKALGVIPGNMPAVLDLFYLPAIRNHRRISVGDTFLTMNDSLEALSMLRLLHA
jgi:L-asparaginase II